jgi:hypothetical protein
MTSVSRCKEGEVPVERSIRFRTLGCYPLTGAVESEAKTLPEVIQEMLLTTTSPNGRAASSTRMAAMRRWRKRSRRGISDVDPIYKTDALIAEDIDAYLEQHQHKSLLRFITCGSSTTANQR